MADRILLRPELETPEQRPPQGAYFLLLESDGTLTIRDWLGNETTYSSGSNDFEWEVKDSSFTAEINGAYTVVNNATVTDPTPPSEGASYTVFVRNGTATIGGTGFSVAGTQIKRVWHSGSWVNYSYNVASTFVPYTGATGDMDLGVHNINGQSGNNIVSIGASGIGLSSALNSLDVGLTQSGLQMTGPADETSYFLNDGEFFTDKSVTVSSGVNEFTISSSAATIGSAAGPRILNALGIPSYANDGAAGSGGLTTGQCYWNTSTSKVTAKT